MHALSNTYSPNDSAPNLAEQAQGKLRQQRAKRAGGALVAALAVGALGLGGHHLLSGPTADSAVVVNAASNESGTPANKAPAKKAEPSLLIEHEKKHTLNADVIPQEDTTIPVVTVNQQQPTETLLALADRLATTDGYPLKKGYYVHKTKVFEPTSKGEYKRVGMSWVSADAKTFNARYEGNKKPTITPEKITSKGQEIQWRYMPTTPYDYTNKRYVTANGDGEALFNEFVASTKPGRKDLARVMFKEFGHDHSMPMSGVQQAGMLRALAKAGKVQMSDVTKDYFGRDVVTVWAANDQFKTGLKLSARTGAIVGSSYGSGENFSEDYTFFSYVKAAQ